MFGTTTKITHDIIKDVMGNHMESREKIVAVDATMGNGNDTLFMAKLFGDGGSVFSFDIQQMAIDTTSKLVEEHHLSNVELILDGHESIDRYVSYADLIMFNLGYLPKGDHSLITQPTTTITAMTKSLELLRQGGLLSIIIYYGHEGGRKEKEVVEIFLANLDPRNYDTIRIDQPNRPNNPPIIAFVRKK